MIKICVVNFSKCNENLRLEENIIRIISKISDMEQEFIIKELINSRFHIELLKKKGNWNNNMIIYAIRILGNICYYDEVDLLVSSINNYICLYYILSIRII